MKMLWFNFAVAIFCSSENSFARDHSEQERICAEADRQERDQMQMPRTAVPDYIVPLLNATFGSAWCICRDEPPSTITSPHVGQDYYDRKIPNYSLAISNGTVASIQFIQGCGYEVMFDDSDGARWRYLHLNKPSYAVGQKFWRGEVLGVHQNYPKDCGNGPHLHLQRMVKGNHPGELTKGTCKKGVRNCFYDPVTLFRDKKNVRTEAERQKVVAESKNGTAQIRINTDCVACRSRQPTPVDLGYDTIEEIGGDQAELRQKARIIPARNSRDLIDWSAELVIGGIPNPKNICSSLSDCIIGIEFHMKTKTGTWKRLFTDASVRNTPLKLSAESAFCWPEESTGQYRVVARTLRGRQLVEVGQALN